MGRITSEQQTRYDHKGSARRVTKLDATKKDIVESECTAKRIYKPIKTRLNIPNQIPTKPVVQLTP